jgi:plasmid maintenance system killer protein
MRMMSGISMPCEACMNDQFRLILEIEPAAGGNIVIVVRVEDYH